MTPHRGPSARAKRYPSCTLALWARSCRPRNASASAIDRGVFPQIANFVDHRDVEPLRHAQCRQSNEDRRVGVNQVGANLAGHRLHLALERLHQLPLARQRYAAAGRVRRAPVQGAGDGLAHGVAVWVLSGGHHPRLETHSALEVHDIAASNAVAAQQRQRIVQNV